MTAPTWLRMIVPSPTPMTPQRAGPASVPSRSCGDVAAAEDEPYAAPGQYRVANREGQSLADNAEDADRRARWRRASLRVRVIAPA